VRTALAQSSSPQRPTMRALASGDLPERWNVRRGADREAGDPSLQLHGIQSSSPGGTVTPPALSPRERKEFIGRARTGPPAPTTPLHSIAISLSSALQSNAAVSSAAPSFSSTSTSSSVLSRSSDLLSQSEVPFCVPTHNGLFCLLLLLLLLLLLNHNR
jgi:hypothetical protein